MHGHHALLAMITVQTDLVDSPAKPVWGHLSRRFECAFSMNSQLEQVTHAWHLQVPSHMAQEALWGESDLEPEAVGSPPGESNTTQAQAAPAGASDHDQTVPETSNHQDHSVPTGVGAARFAAASAPGPTINSAAATFGNASQSGNDQWLESQVGSFFTELDTLSANDIENLYFAAEGGNDLSQSAQHMSRGTGGATTASLQLAPAQECGPKPIEDEKGAASPDPSPVLTAAKKGEHGMITDDVEFTSQQAIASEFPGISPQQMPEGGRAGISPPYEAQVQQLSATQHTPQPLTTTTSSLPTEHEPIPTRSKRSRTGVQNYAALNEHGFATKQPESNNPQLRKKRQK